jgi:hypothetical protein
MKMYTGEKWNSSPPRNAKIFDQFALAEQFGNNYVLSSMAMLIFRNLLRHKELGEGTLAAKIGTRIFRPDWKPLIERLHEMGYVAFTPTGHALTRTVKLTQPALDFLAEKEIEPEPEPETQPQPTE